MDSNSFGCFRKLKFVVLGVVAAAVVSGCNRDNILEEAGGRVIVVATIPPLADWAEQVGGDHVYVRTLLPPGVSPHTFDPSPRDMRMISQAKLLVKVGLHMDDWGASLARAAGSNGPQVVSLGEILEEGGKLPDVEHLDEHDHDHHHHGDDDHDHHHHHHHHGVNPHFWLDPVVAMDCVGVIRDMLIEADPENREHYEANAAAYTAELSELHNEMAGGLEAFGGRGFVSFHNAWPYLAARYNLDIAAVIEEYAGKTPGERYLRMVTDRVKELGIKTIFSEPQLNPRVAEVLAQEVGAQVRVLDPYGTPGEEERDSYVKTMQYNLGQLQAAFGAEQEGNQSSE